MTTDKLIAELDRALQFPGVSNAWTMPIKARIDMLATGIRTPVGVKLLGRDYAELEAVARQVEAAIHAVPGTTSAHAERVTGGYFLARDDCFQVVNGVAVLQALQHRVFFVEAGIAQAEPDQEAVDDTEPDDISAWAEFHEQVERLPEAEREVFSLLWYDGLSQDEASQLLDTSVRTIKRRWQTARFLLFNALHGNSPSP